MFGEQFAHDVVVDGGRHVAQWNVQVLGLPAHRVADEGMSSGQGVYVSAHHVLDVRG